MAEMTRIAVVGNPNSGKTTLFNGLTGSRQRIGNWPGVTVEKKEGTVALDGKNVILVDLPGVYSLAAHSEDEKIARNYIMSGEPGMVVNIVDAANLERNLYLTTQLLEMRVPLLLVVNMQDLAAKKGVTLDLVSLEKKLGCPVIGISATNKKDIQRVKSRMAEALLQTALRAAKIIYPPEIEDALERLSPKLESAAASLGANARWAGLELLGQEPWVTAQIVAAGSISPGEIREEISLIKSKLGEATDIILADARFKFIQDTLGSLLKRSALKESAGDRMDRVVMHRAFGIPIFLLIMYAIFWFTMSIGGAFIDFFDILFGAVFVDGFGWLLTNFGSPEWLIALLAGGLGAGIQTVATFIPIIFVMFFMLSLLEDSGYMARAAFVMDRFLRMIGLPGKSFVPMLVGFGCTVPAVMATRTLENKKDRYLTVFMTPFMSCGARLPVYALFGAAFFGAGAGNMVFSIYLIGIVLAVLTGLLLKHTLFKGEAAPFIMELPPYHVPKLKNILTYTWHRLRLFMLRAGKVIVIVVLVLGFLNSLGLDGTFGNEDTPDSVLTRIGQGISPVFRPMGVEEENWPAAVAVFTGIFAKEVVVGTLNSLYAQMEAGAEEGAEDAAAGEEAGFNLGGKVVEAFASIPEALAGIFGSLLDPLGIAIVEVADEEELAEELGVDTAILSSMQRYFPQGPWQAYAYLLFILIYFPCAPALGVVMRELGRGYGLILAAYLTLLGWVVATLFYQLTLGRQAVWIAVPVLLMIGMVFFFRWLGKGSHFHTSVQSEKAAL